MKRFSDYKPSEHGLNKVLGTLESEVMDAIWRKGSEVTVREIFDKLALSKDIAYTTVMTIMVRLADKNILDRRKDGKTLYFIPFLSKEEFTSKMVGNVVDSLLEDFAEATMAHFISRVKKGDRQTIEKLEQLLALSEDGEANGI
ncbi:putative transcriptional regulator [Natranaerovirga pectinivora]|uniref:Putative transcriptional regulator n=1 Tax=Natranaerovirga pectinivora TaxID=682400 RepID=A0A4R3MMG6_9FIRM|nr:BlaI/MecI/CopY family transcriptional regulator [Natranaerovirga pectinivora]TCT16149.1 putative transcriptional regulator [Natranaerovirga pectinivora]